MNIKQMKAAVSKFRSADVSIIKDEKLRAKAQKLQGKQGGFTLLELLVVITLLATLATAALVAYEGIGENASDAAAANSLLTAESAIRNFRAIENVYPNQWDNLANLAGDDMEDASGGISGTNADLLAGDTRDFFGDWLASSADAATQRAVFSALENVGINELQTIDASGASFANLVPNLAWNESGNASASELEFGVDGTTLTVEFDGSAESVYALSIVPAGGPDGATTCSAGGQGISTPFNDEDGAIDNSSRLNLINDAIGDEACALVIALGYGKDVPGTTIDSRVAIAQVPTVGTDDVDPSENYARAIALFQVGVDRDGDNDILATDDDEIFEQARLIGVVDPEGRAIDTVLAAANEGGVSGDND